MVTSRVWLVSEVRTAANATEDRVAFVDRDDARAEFVRRLSAHVADGDLDDYVDEMDATPDPAQSVHVEDLFGRWTLDLESVVCMPPST